MSVTIVQKNDRCEFVTRNGSIDFIECFKINVLIWNLTLLKISIEGFRYLNETKKKKSMKFK